MVVEVEQHNQMCHEGEGEFEAEQTRKLEELSTYMDGEQVGSRHFMCQALKAPLHTTTTTTTILHTITTTTTTTATTSSRRSTRR